VKDWFAGSAAERYDAETADMPVEPVVRLWAPWAEWDGSPFTSESTKHVSVWEKTG